MLWYQKDKAKKRGAHENIGKKRIEKDTKAKKRIVMDSIKRGIEKEVEVFFLSLAVMWR